MGGSRAEYVPRERIRQDKREEFLKHLSFREVTNANLIV
jgi:hypothetical protein